VMSGSSFRQIHGLRDWPEGEAFGFEQREISLPDRSGMSISFVIGITEMSMADEQSSGGRCSEFSGTDEAVVPSRDNGLRGCTLSDLRGARRRGPSPPGTAGRRQNFGTRHCCHL